MNERTNELETTGGAEGILLPSEMDERERLATPVSDSMNGSPRRMNNQSFAFFGYVLIFLVAIDRPELVLTHPLACQVSPTNKRLKPQ
jgi:hypothetical protein